MRNLGITQLLPLLTPSSFCSFSLFSRFPGSLHFVFFSFLSSSIQSTWLLLLFLFPTFLSHTWNMSCNLLPYLVIKFGNLRLQISGFCSGPQNLPLPFHLRQFTLNTHCWISGIFQSPDLSPYSGHWQMFPATLIYSLSSIIWHWISFHWDRFPGCSCWKRLWSETCLWPPVSFQLPEAPTTAHSAMSTC